MTICPSVPPGQRRGRDIDPQWRSQYESRIESATHPADASVSGPIQERAPKWPSSIRRRISPTEVRRLAPRFSTRTPELLSTSTDLPNRRGKAEGIRRRRDRHGYRPYRRRRWSSKGPSHTPQGESHPRRYGCVDDSKEAPDVPYRRRHPARCMPAGHDAHTPSVPVRRNISRRPAISNGKPSLLIFQPAEGGGRGGDENGQGRQ